jgi:hypothetical protein
MYAVLGLHFQEMAICTTGWQTGVEGFRMQEPALIRLWRKDAWLEGFKEGFKVGFVLGFKEGMLTGTRAAVEIVLQSRFPGTPVPAAVHAALEKNMLVGQLNDWLSEAVKTPSLADFERFLAAAAG